MITSIYENFNYNKLFSKNYLVKFEILYLDFINLLVSFSNYNKLGSESLIL